MEVLDEYFEYLKELVREALDDESLTPRQRLKRYMEIITDKLKRDRWMIGRIGPADHRRSAGHTSSSHC